MPVNAEKNSDDFEIPWLDLPVEGWMDFPIAPPSQAFLNSFDHLVADQYASRAQRERRFSQYKADFIHDTWDIALLPHRPFIQSSEYNSLSGGILREFAPLAPECDIAPYIDHMFGLFNVDATRSYHIDVHQYRVFATPDANGTSVPEGPHRDGQEFVAILVFRRHQITGAELHLIDPENGEIFARTTIGENRGVVLNDRQMLHDATPVAATGQNRGFRDYIVINITRFSSF